MVLPLQRTRGGPSPVATSEIREQLRPRLRGHRSIRPSPEAAAVSSCTHEQSRARPLPKTRLHEFPPEPTAPQTRLQTLLVLTSVAKKHGFMQDGARFTDDLNFVLMRMVR